MARTFEEISKDLNAALLDVYSKKDDRDKAEAKANKMIEDANEMKKMANTNLLNAQEKAVELRREAQSLLDELAPLNQESRVRVSG